MELNDFYPGDIILITYTYKDYSEIRLGQVVMKNYNGMGLINYSIRN